jgi:lipopolysaccharide biosynthesis glycosyltransferase
MQDTIHIAIPATGEYRRWAEVCAASAKRGSSLPVEVHYIDWDVIDRNKLEALGSWHGSAITFSRIYLAELFPELDWIITSDADVLFRGDIAELWALRDDAVAFIAHKDCPLPPQKWNAEQHAWFEDHHMLIKDWSTYFADGMGLVNLKRWREKGYQAEFERLAKEYRNLPSPDMMILNYILQDDKKLLPAEWDCFSGDENADIDWSKSGCVHFVEDTPWKRYKITHLASDLVEEWWKIAEDIGIDKLCLGYHGCRNKFDWAWRRFVFVFLKHNQWILRLNRNLWLHLRSTRGVNAQPKGAR